MTAIIPFSAWAEMARAARPRAAIVLGSGMGDIGRRLTPLESLPFAEIPGMTSPSIPGHAGNLVLGDWAGRRVLLFEGRLHFYEGHAWRGVTTPVNMAAFLGARVLLLTNAVGGIHDELGPGSLMAIRDHVEWTRPYCWRHPGPGGLGLPRSSPYSSCLLEVLDGAARNLGIRLPQGIYAAVTGPNYETPAEIRALKQWGADAVGMSTAREVQFGCDRGMQCAGVSLVTNRAAGLGETPIHHGEVLQTAAAQSERLADLIEEFLKQLD